jgi:C1A family cysteine protease
MKDKNNRIQRKIDETVKKTTQDLGSQFTVISKMEIKAWKAYLALFFITGLAIAIIFLVQINIQTKSSAKSTRAEELEQIKKAIKEKGAKWEAADNPIFQLSDEDRKKRVNLKKSELPKDVPEMPQNAGIIPPATLDWRNNGGNFVTPIRNQGNCGSCWAFSTTAGLEAYTLIQNNQPGTNLDTSEQILVSCSGSGSCGGGGPDYAARYIRDVGLPSESCFPYTATDVSCSGACADWKSSTYKVGSIVSVPKTVSDIKTALATYGPLPTVFNVYQDFFSYRSGVYSYTTGSFAGGHAVLIVGYDDPGQYFVVKNSWGAGWGEAGYFKIAYSELNTSINFGSGTLAYSNAVPQVTSISVTAPNGGESFDAGGLNRTITWNYVGDSTAYVKIELVKNGIAVTNISSSTPINQKSYNYWSIPQTQTPGTDYKIRITSTGNGVTDSSNSDFAITAPIPASLSVISPNGGEAWSQRSAQTIKWNYTGNPGSTAKLELLKGNVLQQTIANVNVASSSFNWKLPSGLIIGTDYKIRITSTTNNIYTDSSDNDFSVIKITGKK